MDKQEFFSFYWGSKFYGFHVSASRFILNQCACALVMQEKAQFMIGPNVHRDMS